MLPAFLTALLLSALPALANAQTFDFSVLNERPRVQFDLIGELEEISGLAWHPDGYLLAHNDELGIVYRLNPSTGQVEGRGRFGGLDSTGDFEGIALAGRHRALVVTSSGRLIDFAIDQGETRARELGLQRVCEIEGLALARSQDELILACKTLYQGTDRDALVLLRTPLEDDTRGSPELLLAVSSDQLREANVPRPFRASGVEVVPGGYLVVSARHARVLHLSEAGEIMDVARLDRRRHPQAEGITVDAQGRVWIADEGDGGRARLTRYGGTP